jgi:hypothetical protein
MDPPTVPPPVQCVGSRPTPKAVCQDGRWTLIDAVIDDDLVIDTGSIVITNSVTINGNLTLSGSPFAFAWYRSFCVGPQNFSFLFFKNFPGEIVIPDGVTVTVKGSATFSSTSQLSVPANSSVTPIVIEGDLRLATSLNAFVKVSDTVTTTTTNVKVTLATFSGSLGPFIIARKSHFICL